MVVHCSDPLFIVPQTTAFVFSDFGRISGVCQSQKNNPKIWSILNLLHLLTSYLFNKKNSSVAGVFKIMYLPPTATEPRGGFRTLSSI